MSNSLAFFRIVTTGKTIEGFALPEELDLLAEKMKAPPSLQSAVGEVHEISFVEEDAPPPHREYRRLILRVGSINALEIH